MINVNKCGGGFSKEYDNNYLLYKKNFITINLYELWSWVLY